MGKCAAKGKRPPRCSVAAKEDWDQKMSEAIEHGRVVIVNFTATRSSPCRVIASFDSDLSEMHPLIMLLMVNVDELVEFSKSWEIEATPTFFFLKDGQQVDKLIGANKPEFRRIVNSIQSLPSSSELQPQN